MAKQRRTRATRPQPAHLTIDASQVAPRRGWSRGRAAHIASGTVYLGTSVQVAGLFPFPLAGGLPTEGVPIGADLLTGELVCLDPPGWVGTLTTNPSVWLQGSPGTGKSALAKRLSLGLVAYGYTLLCPGDVKGEYAGLVTKLGGQVVRVGRGLDAINPLDSGPLGRGLDQLPRGEAERIRAELNGRRAELLHALLATPHGLGRRPSAEESAAVNAAVRIAAEASRADPTIPDVIKVLRTRPAAICERLIVSEEAEYLRAVRGVVAALENLCDGPLSGLFDRPTSRPLDLDKPALTIDLSHLLSAGDDVVAAGLLATWSYSYAAVDTARALGRMPRPVVLPLDELWRALRAGPGMVAAMDGITRLNRSKGEVSIMITHSLQDLEALPTEEDRAKARGLMERCDTVVLAALSVGELHRISQQKPLTDGEIELVASWAAPTATGLDGTSQLHPGRGKYLIKIGQRSGVPVRLQLTATEQSLYDTDAAMRTRRESASS
ncbi:ATPase [Planobispora rosea]|uniref:ATPase n=1 Tax=Planobispora rosea TaxID=35762 RepID=A0A8J3WGR7_PLARO|nr:ATP-binding protein [Planobispora rosea]GGS99015.1 ATPase [Planobispora rosea]GIH88007.1 ATPase [Planobispora rosea]